MQVFFRRMAWLLLLGVAVVTVSPIGLRPVTGAPADVERALAFGLIGAAVCLGYPRHRAVVLLVIALAGLLEAAQSLVPGRHGRMHDFVVKGPARSPAPSWPRSWSGPGPASRTAAGSA